jgi:predicted dehydrogenase
VSSRPRTDIAQRPDDDGVLHDCTAEDGLLATLRTGGGIEVRLDSTFAAHGNDPPRITIVGTDGRIDNTADDILNTRTEHGESTRDFRDGERGDRHLRAMRRWAEVVRDSVLGGAALPGASTLHDGLACDRVLDSLRAG